jgi:hypothetical protein
MGNREWEIGNGGFWGKINRVCVGPAIWGVKDYPGSQTLPKTGAGIGIGTTFGSFRGAHTPKVFFAAALGRKQPSPQTTLFPRPCARTIPPGIDPTRGRRSGAPS